MKGESVSQLLGGVTGFPISKGGGKGGRNTARKKIKAALSTHPGLVSRRIGTFAEHTTGRPLQSGSTGGRNAGIACVLYRQARDAPTIFTNIPELVCASRTLPSALPSQMTKRQMRGSGGAIDLQGFFQPICAGPIPCFGGSQLYFAVYPRTCRRTERPSFARVVWLGQKKSKKTKIQIPNKTKFWL